MKETNDVKTMRRYVAQLNEAAAAYYGGRGELMTDYEWDALFDKLRALEAKTGIVLPDSPTAKVSADDTAGQKEKHEFPALSLAKTKSVAEVARWAEGRPIWLSWKLDGLTLVATWDDGKLTRVLTRGDGHVGTNITHLASAIRGLPATVPTKGHLVVRGEAVIAWKDFRAFTASSSESFANPRVLASGSLTLKDIDELAKRSLQWVPFTFVDAPGRIVSWGARMDRLEKLGLSCVERELVKKPTESALQAVIDKWTRKVTDGEAPFPVDGLVVCYDDTEYAKTGSVTGHHATRAGFAFKWKDESAESTLDHVEWSCAVGSISPIAVFKPVPLEGTIVKRASLCNVTECERLGIGGPGTKLSIIKSNKIIPKVVAVTKTVGKLAIPSKCPVCRAPTEVRTSTGGVKTLVCTNESCPARELRKFVRFADDRTGLGIEGLAEETIAKLVDSGLLKTPGDIFRLGAHRDEIAAIDGFGDKSADKLIAAIEKARHVSAVAFVTSLSIPLFGPETVRSLLSAHPTADLFALAAGPGDPADELAALDGIGAARAASFVAWCRTPANKALVADLLASVTLEEVAATSAGSRCDGLVFVVTGSLEQFESRDAFKAYVLSQGGKVSGSVSSATNFLVNNDVASTSGKNRKARELGTTILSEADFIARFGAPGR